VIGKYSGIELWLRATPALVSVLRYMLICIASLWEVAKFASGMAGAVLLVTKGDFLSVNSDVRSHDKLGASTEEEEHVEGTRESKESAGKQSELVWGVELPEGQPAGYTVRKYTEDIHGRVAKE
jgi:hypothetical protein